MKFNLTETALPPVAEAIGALCLIPVLALIFILAAGLLLLGWPFIPVLVYLYNTARAKAQADAKSEAMLAAMEEKS